MSDPTAAERARRYRARRRDRDVTAYGDLRELVASVRRLVELLERDVTDRHGYPQSPGDVDKRDAKARHGRDRDVTERHGAEGARARTRTHAAPTPLRASSEPPGESSRVTDPTVDPRVRILEALAGRSPHSVGAIADALGLGRSETAAQLVALAGMGRVRRIAGTLPSEPDGWALVAVESPAETIDCTAYRDHQLGHRRDPATGRFRCYVCAPDGRAPDPIHLAPAAPA